MALTLTTGSSQGTASTGSTFAIDIPDDGAYLLEVSAPGESTFKNVTGPITQPNRIKVASSEVADMFKNVPLTPGDGQSLTGRQILVQVTETWKVADPADASIEPLYFPASAHFVLKVPTHDLVGDREVAQFIERMLGAIYPAAVTTDEDAVMPLLRGVTQILLP